AESACDHCHGTKYTGLVGQWKQALEQHLEQADAAMARAEAAFAAASPDPVERLRLQRLLDDARHNIRFARIGRGEHNINYATAMLNRAIENCRVVETAPVPVGAGEGSP